MADVLNRLVQISLAVGTDKSLVLGGSGNASVKTADAKSMYIKASGAALKDMSRRRGWRKLNFKKVCALLEDKSLEKTEPFKRHSELMRRLTRACDDKKPARGVPSVESCFHTLLDRVVIHLHPQAVLCFACSKNGRDRLAGLFRRQSPPPLWVPYAEPGFALAKMIRTRLCDYKKSYGCDPSILFLQNHGLVVSTPTCDDAIRLVHKVVNSCAGNLKLPKPARIVPPGPQTVDRFISPIRDYLHATGRRDLAVEHVFDEKIAAFSNAANAAVVCSRPAVTPEEVILTDAPPVWVERADCKSLLQKLKKQIAAGRRQGGFLVKGVGLFVIAEKQKSELVKDVITAHLSIRFFAAGFGGIMPLNKKQQRFITACYGQLQPELIAFS